MSESQPKPSRRGFVFGATAAGAAVASVAVLPQLQPQALPVAEVLREPPANGGGYQLTEHVRRYYKTTLL